MRKVGIDLGTTNLLICVDNDGVIVDEPSVLTIDAQTKKCIAAGKAAKELLGRTPGSLISIRPLKDGVIADFDATEMLLNYFFKQCNLQGMFRNNIIPFSYTHRSAGEPIVSLLPDISKIFPYMRSDGKKGNE